MAGQNRMLRQLQLWDVDSSEHAWSVRQSARARRLSVRVFRNGGVEIVVPPRTLPRRLSKFGSEHREWIERQRRRAVPAVDWPLPPDVLSLTAIDEEWRCSAVAGTGQVGLREIAGYELQLRGRLDDRARLRRLLANWLVERARRRLEGPLRGAAAPMAGGPRRLPGARQRARAGASRDRCERSLRKGRWHPGACGCAASARAGAAVRAAAPSV